MDSRLDEEHVPAADAVARQVRTALGAGALQLHYQPIVSLPSATVVGMEALIRWPASATGLPETMSATDLVTAAERGPLIRQLGEFVLTQACRDRQACCSGQVHPVYVALNVSAAQLDDDSTVDHIRQLVAGSGLNAELLCLEITETVALRDIEQASRRLSSLRELGCRIALDDFGTGYASLGLLRDLPLDLVKIDRTFVDRVDTSPIDAVLVRSIIETAHALGLRVCAEGITTVDQARQLVAMGCDLGQGWLFGRAMPHGPDLHELACSGRPVNNGLSTDRPPPLQLGERDQLVVVADTDLRVRYASSGSLPLLGVAPAALMGSDLGMFVVQDVREPGERVVEVRHSDGHPHWLRGTTQRLPSPSGGSEQILWVAVDATVAVGAQRALAQSEGRFRTAFDEAPIGMAINTLEGHYLRANRAFTRLVGRSNQELMGLRYQEMTHPDDAASDRRNTEELVAGTATSHSIRKRYLHPDGGVVLVDLRSSLVLDDDGKPSYVVVHILPVEPGTPPQSAGGS